MFLLHLFFFRICIFSELRALILFRLDKIMTVELGFSIIEKFVTKIDASIFWNSAENSSPPKKRPRKEEENEKKKNISLSPNSAHEIVKTYLAPLLAPDVVSPAGEKSVVENRKVGFFVLPEYQSKMRHTQGYKYSNEDHDAILAPEQILPVVEYVERRCKELELSNDKTTNFHVNEYTAEGVLGYHCDSEIGMKPDAPIISLSFGSTRIFRVAVWLCKYESKNDFQVINPKYVSSHNKKFPNDKCVCVSKDFELRHGDIIVMLSGCQKIAKHSIILCRKKEYPIIKNDSYGGIRHNVTFRVFEMKNE